MTLVRLLVVIALFTAPAVSAQNRQAYIGVITDTMWC
jgi:hypothetical protein